MSPEAVVAVERNYVRFGLAGLIVARLLPGFRSFTAPFAGLMRLGPVRTLVPIGSRRPSGTVGSPFSARGWGRTGPRSSV